MIEICPKCGRKNDLGTTDLNEDYFYPGIYNYQCSNCGQFNRIHSRKFFVNPMEFKNYTPKPQNIIDVQKPKAKEIDYDFTSSQMLPDNPFAPILKKFEDAEKEYDIEPKRAHNKPIVHGFGSNRIKCPHLNVITRNGITYCTACGKNFPREESDVLDESEEEYNFDLNTPQNEMINDIFEQRPGRGRPSKAIFDTRYPVVSFSNDLKESNIEENFSEQDEMINDIFSQGMEKRGRKSKIRFEFDEKDMSIKPFSK